MGIINTRCRYAKTEENEEECDDENKEKSDQEQSKKRVMFAPNVEQRYFMNREDVEFNLGQYNDVSGPNNDPSLEESMAEEVPMLSFEGSENRFVIEDYYHKQLTRINRRVEDIDWIKGLGGDEISNWKSMVNEAIGKAQSSRTIFHRIDGILINKDSKDLILLTEFYIFYFQFLQESKPCTYSLRKSVVISMIDYITLFRSGNKLIIHLAQTSESNSTNQSLTIVSQQANELCACIASTYLLDKPYNFSHNMSHGDRSLSVIILNEGFNISTQLEAIKTFQEYQDFLNGFLDKALAEAKLPKFNIELKYKYCAVKYRYKDNETQPNKGLLCVNKSSAAPLIEGDMIVTRNSIYILKYKSTTGKFKLVIHIEMDSLVSRPVNHTKNSFIIYDNKTLQTGLEVWSESCTSLAALLCDFVKL